MKFGLTSQGLEDSGPTTAIFFLHLVIRCMFITAFWYAKKKSEDEDNEPDQCSFSEYMLCPVTVAAVISHTLFVQLELRA